MNCPRCGSTNTLRKVRTKKRTLFNLKGQVRVVSDDCNDCGWHYHKEEEIKSCEPAATTRGTGRPSRSAS